MIRVPCPCTRASNYISNVRIYVIILHNSISCCHPLQRGGVTQWVARLTRNVEVVGSSPITSPVVSLSKKVYPCCLALVGSRNGVERDFTIEQN